MKRAIGIGGVFIKSKDPKALSAWYQKHLGINLLEWGGAVFSWDEQSKTSKNGATIWSMFPDNSDYFDPSYQKVMLKKFQNYLKLQLFIYMHKELQILK